MPFETWNDMIGTQIGPEGRYTIRQRIGEGGMGVVFEAHEPVKDRSVAIKVLNAEVGGDSEVLQRFRREGTRFRKLRHDNIVRVYGMGRAKGSLYIASEFVNGTPLYDVIRNEGAMEVDRALSVVGDIAKGLAFAHDAGVIHRDLKPENVMLTHEDQKVKILDFGIAKDLNASVALTVRGAYIGTPAYSSPEQIKGDAIDGRSDIFSLGVILYELVTGEVPFKGRKTAQILSNTIKVDPVNPSRLNAEVSAPVARLIAKMIAKKKRQRPESCKDVLERIEAVRAALSDPDLQSSSDGVAGFLRNIFKG